MPDLKKEEPPKEEEKQTFDVDTIVLENRQVFIYEEITDKLALKIIKQLMVLDDMSNDAITMWINSPGGSCTDGLAIIEAMRMINSPIVTIINGRACSMASVISVCGNKRYAFNTSVYMMHPLSSWNSDYLPYMQDRFGFIEKLDKVIVNLQKKHTRFSKTDWQKAKNGELWLFGKEMITKGVIDGIIR